MYISSPNLPSKLQTFISNNLFYISTSMTHCHLNIFKSELGKMTSVGEDVGKFEPLYIAGSNEKWFSRYGKQFGGSSKSETEN